MSWSWTPLITVHLSKQNLQTDIRISDIRIRIPCLFYILTFLGQIYSSNWSNTRVVIGAGLCSSRPLAVAPIVDDSVCKKYAFWQCSQVTCKDLDMAVDLLWRSIYPLCSSMAPEERDDTRDTFNELRIIFVADSGTCTYRGSSVCATFDIWARAELTSRLYSTVQDKQDTILPTLVFMYWFVILAMQYSIGAMGTQPPAGSLPGLARDCQRHVLVFVHAWTACTEYMHGMHGAFIK